MLLHSNDVKLPYYLIKDWLISQKVSEAEERVGAVTSKHVFAVGKKSALKVRKATATLMNNRYISQSLVVLDIHVIS